MGHSSHPCHTPSKARHPLALVVDGSGMLGAILTRRLQSSGWRTASLDLPEDEAGLSVFQPKDVEDCVEKKHPDAIINAVLWPAIDKAEFHPEEARGLLRELPECLGRLAGERGIQLVHYSTSYVFDGKKGAPYTEKDAPNPINTLGRAKAEADQSLLCMGLEKLLIIRLGWVFGPSRGTINDLLDAAEDKGFLAMAQDIYGSPAYAPDIAAATLALLEAGASGLINFANRGEANICELGAEALRLANRPAVAVGIESSRLNLAARRPPYSVLDTSLYTQTTGLTPRPWIHALREYVFSGFLDSLAPLPPV